MDSNETVLMCDEASVTNAPLCIHQSPQIINQLDGQFWKKVVPITRDNMGWLCTLLHT